MAETALSLKLTINDLFLRYDYSIDVNDGLVVIFGENGKGKTAALRILSSIASGDWSILRGIEFASLQIEFSDAEFNINYADIQDIFIKSSGIAKNSFCAIDDYFRELGLSPKFQKFQSKERTRIAKTLTVSRDEVQSYIDNYLYFDIGNNANLIQLDRYMNDHHDFNVVFLTTYRNHRPFKIGSAIPSMGEDECVELTALGHAQKLLAFVARSAKNSRAQSNPANTDDKIKLMNKIEKFNEAINDYLFDKIIIFDIEDYEFKIYHFDRDEDTDDDLDHRRKLCINSLSSGEKQLFTFFTLAYFAKNNTILAIDEPEISLSFEWQKRLLPDLRNGTALSGIFAVTHSPFIIDNDIASYRHFFVGNHG